jgi:pyruvate carboxylase
MAGTTSQPSLSALVAATDGTERRPGWTSTSRLRRWSPTGRPCAQIYKPFESGLASPTGRVYFHEIPGGQLSNLRQQAIALGLGDRFEDIEDMYAAANRILGNIVKVTPSSKVVGDLALALVGPEPTRDFEANPTRYDIPDSVIGFLEGELGDPPGGWPEPFRTKALEGRTAKARHTELTPEQESALPPSPAAR